MLKLKGFFKEIKIKINHYIKNGKVSRPTKFTKLPALVAGKINKLVNCRGHHFFFVSKKQGKY